MINPLSTADRPLVNRSLCSSIDLHRISLVHASGETFRQRVFDALEGTRDACILGELFCRRPVLPDPASPSAVRPDSTRPWFVRVLDSTAQNITFVSFTASETFDVSLENSKNLVVYVGCKVVEV